MVSAGVRSLGFSLASGDLVEVVLATVADRSRSVVVKAHDIAGSRRGNRNHDDQALYAMSGRGSWVPRPVTADPNLIGSLLEVDGQRHNA